MAENVFQEIVAPAHKTYNLTSWQSDTLNTERSREFGEGRVMVSPDEGNLWASLNTDGGHSIVLDVDFPARLVPSSTPGHFHLIVDGLSVTWEKYEAFLKACADVGLISRHYLGHSLARKMTMIRKEGVPKVYFDHDFSSSDAHDDEPWPDAPQGLS